MLNPAEEAKFAELKEKCRELKVPAPPEIIINFRVRDRNGVLVLDDDQRAHSWTRNYYDIMCSQISTVAMGTGGVLGAGYLTCKNTAGSIPTNASKSAQYSNSNGITGAGIIEATSSGDHGILIGTGTTAFSPENYGMGTKIVSGIGSGQMSYVAMAASSATYTADTKTWAATVARIFNNNSGGSITVGEVGLVTFTTVQSMAAYWLVERSVLSPTVAVADGAQLTVTYTISMDFSAID